MDVEDAHIGRRVREIRTWRGISLTAAAGLAGISVPYLSLIERGHRPVTKRAVLEALAQALKVSPVELTGKPYAPSDAASAEAHAAVVGVEEALVAIDLGANSDAQPRAWPELAISVARLENELVPAADFAGQGELIPGLLVELHVLRDRDTDNRREIQVALLRVCHRAAVLLKTLGVRGFPLIAASHAQRVAEELGEPAWLGYAAWSRGSAAASAGRVGRRQQYSLSVAAADDLMPHLDDADAAQAYGMLHLNAALACAAQQQNDEAMSHLHESAAIAGRLDDEVGTFGGLCFGRTNVGVSRVSLAAELGDGAQVMEAAREVRVEAIPSTGRQGAYLADVGRTLAAERRTREQGIRNLLKAESLAPQLVRNNVFVRETVSDLLASARRDAGGRDLRGLAWRLGVAPIG